MSVTSSKASYRYGFQPLVSGCFVSDANKESFDDILYGQSGPGETAAVIVEPVQGEAGVNVIPPSFMRHLRQQCDKHGICLIADEVQSGAGRTGTMWAVEHSGVVPDSMPMAKG